MPQKGNCPKVALLKQAWCPLKADTFPPELQQETEVHYCFLDFTQGLVRVVCSLHFVPSYKINFKLAQKVFLHFFSVFLTTQQAISKEKGFNKFLLELSLQEKSLFPFGKKLSRVGILIGKSKVKV